MLVSGVFALHMANMVLVGSIRTVHLCDLSMHEGCRAHIPSNIAYFLCTHFSVLLHCKWPGTLFMGNKSGLQPCAPVLQQLALA